MMLVKNPAGCNQVIEFLENVREKFILVVCLNDRSADGTDISWIWDADFEGLSKLSGYLEKVVVSGDRASDMALRIKYAGIAPEYIETERSYEKLVSWIEQQGRAGVHHAHLHRHAGAAGSGHKPLRRQRILGIRRRCYGA